MIILDVFILYSKYDFKFCFMDKIYLGNYNFIFLFTLNSYNFYLKINCFNLKK